MAKPGKINNTIMVSVGADSPYLEGIADEIIYPGMLLTLINSVGHYSLAHGTGDTYSPLFAVENPYEGKGVDDPYAIGERMMMRYGRTGDIFLTKIAYSAVSLVYCGQPLISAGDTHTAGWFKDVELADDGVPVGYCIDAEISSPSFPEWVRMVIK